MLRRSKDDKEPKASDEPVEDDEEAASGAEDPMDERLAPLEEFRGKTDQWMKETSAQLARVATHVQQDEKRQEKLDSRLAEFEDRIQAMLTLTEALSAGENPFVRKQGEAAPPVAHDPEPNPFLAAPQERKTATSSDTTARREPPTWDKEQEGEPAETQIVRAEQQNDEVRRAEAATAAEGSPGHEANPLPASKPPQAPREPAPSPPRAPEPTEPFRGHPNDPSFDSYAPDDGTDAPFHDDGATARPLDETPHLDGIAAQEAEKRLILLQWARLLARQMRRMDIEEFLETYVDTGWVTTEQVAKVRALAADLARHSGAPVERLSREDLHVRTILILSSMPTRQERRARAAATNAPEAGSATEDPIARGD